MKKNILIEKIKSLSNYKIIDVIKNYKKYNYPEFIKKEAIKILKSRNISQSEIEKILSEFEIITQQKKDKINTLHRFYKNYIIYNIIANILIVFAIILICYAFINKNYFTKTVIASLLGAFFIVLFYLISLIAFKNYISFYDICRQDNPSLNKKSINYFFFSWIIGLIINIKIMKKRMEEYKK